MAGNEQLQQDNCNSIRIIWEGGGSIIWIKDGISIQQHPVHIAMSKHDSCYCRERESINTFCQSSQGNIPYSLISCCFSILSCMVRHTWARLAFIFIHGIRYNCTIVYLVLGSQCGLLVESWTRDRTDGSSNSGRSGWRIFFFQGLTLCADSYSVSVPHLCYHSGI